MWPQVLVGNKCDMDEAKRRVPYSQGQALADEFGIKFFETSAKSNIKVDEVTSSLRLPWQAGLMRAVPAFAWFASQGTAMLQPL
jgi:hypothetical protein